MYALQARACSLVRFGVAGTPGAVRALAVGLLALPLAGLALLLAAPPIDAEWENQPSHFWLVLSVAVVNVVLGLVTGESASRRDNPRVFLVSLALLASAGFLGLHALSTPGVLAHEGNTGFVIATPLGLLLASVFAAASATDLDGDLGGRITASQRLVRRALVVLLVAWAAVSVAHFPRPRQARPRRGAHRHPLAGPDRDRALRLRGLRVLADLPAA